MLLRRLLDALLFTVACLGTAWPALAEPLWAKLIPGQRVEADPDADYELNDTHGPWLIVATTFTGEGAEEQARELVLELRRRYKLEAYTHSKTFDFTGAVDGRGIDRFGDPARMRYRRQVELHEIAVLVGNYPSFDDPTGQAHLEKIKYLKPDALDAKKRGSTSQTLAAVRQMQMMVIPQDDERRQKGPMGKAFISRNPLLPKEFFVQQGVDDFVVKMNEAVSYSLLKCPGQYTLKVATFNGKVVLDQREVQAFETGRKSMETNLAKAAEQAETLTYALRAKGYEAYSFHDRYSSMVTVGSFNSIGTPRPDGTTELHPQIHQLIEVFGADPVPGTGGGFTLKKLANVPFDIQPELVHVPRPAAKTSFVARKNGL